jgi:hypothetical protein
VLSASLGDTLLAAAFLLLGFAGAALGLALGARLGH